MNMTRIKQGNGTGDGHEIDKSYGNRNDHNEIIELMLHANI